MTTVLSSPQSLHGCLPKKTGNVLSLSFHGRMNPISRFRFRFRLRTALFACVCIAVGCAFFGHHWRVRISEERIISSFQNEHVLSIVIHEPNVTVECSCGAFIHAYREWTGPAWLERPARRTGLPIYDRIVRVLVTSELYDLGIDEPSEQSLYALGDLACLRFLDFYGLPISDTCIQQLQTKLPECTITQTRAP